jgi:hypothetical protein
MNSMSFISTITWQKSLPSLISILCISKNYYMEKAREKKRSTSLIKYSYNFYCLLMWRSFGVDFNVSWRLRLFGY